MVQTFEAVFDGEVLRPKTPLDLPANTRVRLTLEVVVPSAEGVPSFLQTAMSLNLNGPPDWSETFDRKQD